LGKVTALKKQEKNPEKYRDNGGRKNEQNKSFSKLYTQKKKDEYAVRQMGTEDQVDTAGPHKVSTAAMRR